jgi:hypothetical protein
MPIIFLEKKHSANSKKLEKMQIDAEIALAGISKNLKDIKKKDNIY